MKKTILIVFAAAVALSVSLVTVRAADEPHALSRADGAHL